MDGERSTASFCVLRKDDLSLKMALSVSASAETPRHFRFKTAEVIDARVVVFPGRMLRQQHLSAPIFVNFVRHVILNMNYNYSHRPCDLNMNYKYSHRLSGHCKVSPSCKSQNEASSTTFFAYSRAKK